MANKNPEDLVPSLRKAWELLHDEYVTRHPDRKVVLTHTYRSPQEQAELYASGRTKPGEIVTMCDGKIHPSKHNRYPAEAFDVAIIINGKAVWDGSFFAELGRIGTQLGLKWGGNFKTFRDFPHFEI